ncbi:hypothetical protein [Pantoea stewartii]|uniref:Uncharacterized protein n=1 Tax=Pantoea stewartii subsp. stewartii DC283 TaxID=660596 RepID=A0ABM6K412_PANSE|nr:hypothetical protein [Pantoea stewartii]ARF49490.1 hypothetical protein DSJ_09175 [Pantoea stewartii subsp. stewartii DC283]KAB0553936.1 hypothetical protein F7Q90_12680 [Pantoea stewartii subsp. stewartii]
MSTLKSCIDCSKCFQAEKTTSGKSLWCLLTRSPFTLRLMLIERLLGQQPETRYCQKLIWRG